VLEDIGGQRRQKSDYRLRVSKFQQLIPGSFTFAEGISFLRPFVKASVVSRDIITEMVKRRDLQKMEDRYSVVVKYEL